MLRKQTGFTLIELLVSLTVTAIVMTGLVTSFSAQNRASVQRDAYLEMEENLRMGMAAVSGMLRNAGYGVPTANLTSWITEVSGFTNDPILIQNGGSTINFAFCTPVAVATITPNDEPVGETLLTINSASNFEVGDLIWIGQSEFAKVVAANNPLSIDTNPLPVASAAGQQGTARPHVQNSPICRVDVYTYSVQQDPEDSTVQSLMLERRDGLGAQVVAQGVSALNLTQVTAGQRYVLTITAQTKDPYSANYVTRTMTSDIALVND